MVDSVVIFCSGMSSKSLLEFVVDTLDESVDNVPTTPCWVVVLLVEGVTRSPFRSDPLTDDGTVR